MFKPSLSFVNMLHQRESPAGTYGIVNGGAYPPRVTQNLLLGLMLNLGRIPNFLG